MKFSYAFRNGDFYPFIGGDRELPSPKIRKPYLSKLSQIGFEGIEILFKFFDPNKSIEDIKLLRKDLEESNLPCVAINAGAGSVADPKLGSFNFGIIERSINLAQLLDAKLVNIAETPVPNPNLAGAIGATLKSQGSSRLAKQDEFNKEARLLAKLADQAKLKGISLTIEIHQHSIADTSWSALRLLELIDRENVGINPDLGNIQQAYATPEEEFEDAIIAVAPHVNYWHCKNANRIPIPQLNETFNIRVPLPYGDINYRFAMTAIKQANYNGYVAIEGIGGDSITKDTISLRYMQDLANDIDN